MWYSKLTLVEVNRILYDLAWDPPYPHTAITDSKGNRFESILLGGSGVEAKTDAGK